MAKAFRCDLCGVYSQGQQHRTLPNPKANNCPIEICLDCQGKYRTWLMEMTGQESPEKEIKTCGDCDAWRARLGRCSNGDSKEFGCGLENRHSACPQFKERNDAMV